MQPEFLFQNFEHSGYRLIGWSAPTN